MTERPPTRATGALRAALPVVLGLAVLAVPLLPVPESWITPLAAIGRAALVVLGLVLLTGVAGMTSFGQAAFVGIGAYATAWATTALGASPWLGLLLGLAAALLVALVLAAATLRLRGHDLPLATIAWGLALWFAAGNAEPLGKFDGLQGIPPIALFGQDLRSGRAGCVLAWACALLAALGLRHLLDSRAGRALRALRDGAGMAEAMGIDTARWRLVAFVLAALLAALAGWLFAHDQRSVNPSPFGLQAGIEFLFMAVVGGAGLVAGAFVGAAVVQLAQDRLQAWLPALLGTGGPVELVVFGVVLVALLQVAPDGLAALVARRLPPRGRDPAAWAGAAPLPRAALPARGSEVLATSALRRDFGGLRAVDDVTLSLRAGELLGLIGPNGAGKSTLFNLVAGGLRASAGEVVLRGARVDGLPARAIACRGLARTFQHVRLVPTMSVLENAALGAHRRGRAGVLRAVLRLDRAEERRLLSEGWRQLERLGLAHLADLPAGHLALGQQRLLEIARALCTDPAVLLLDEPAAGLRAPEKAALAAVLGRLRDEGLALLLVEHDMDFVMALADRLVVLVSGAVLAEGAPTAVQAHPAVRAAYLGEDGP